MELIAAIAMFGVVLVIVGVLVGVWVGVSVGVRVEVCVAVKVGLAVLVSVGAVIGIPGGVGRTIGKYSALTAAYPVTAITVPMIAVFTKSLRAPLDEGLFVG